MKNLSEIKDLIGQEMNILDLDNRMMAEGFLTEANSGVFEDCIRDGNIVYSETTDSLGNTEPTIQIFFEVISLASEEEIIETSILRITEVTEF